MAAYPIVNGLVMGSIPLLGTKEGIMKKREIAEYVKIYSTNARDNLWGVRIRPGMKVRNLPKDLQLAFDNISGDDFKQITYKDGAFHAIRRIATNPLYWPDLEYIKADVGDWIVEDEKWNIYILKSNEVKEIHYEIHQQN